MGRDGASGCATAGSGCTGPRVVFRSRGSGAGVGRSKALETAGRRARGLRTGASTFVSAADFTVARRATRRGVGGGSAGEAPGGIFEKAGGLAAARLADDPRTGDFVTRRRRVPAGFAVLEGFDARVRLGVLRRGVSSDEDLRAMTASFLGLFAGFDQSSRVAVHGSGVAQNNRGVAINAFIISHQLNGAMLLQSCRVSVYQPRVSSCQIERR